MKTKEQCLVIRNEQLAVEILRIRSKYANIKKEYNQFRALVLTPKMVTSASTQTCRGDFKAKPQRKLEKRASLRATYNSPSPCSFGRMLRSRVSMNATPKCDSSIVEKAKPEYFKTYGTVLEKDESIKTVKFLSIRTQSGSNAVLVKSIGDDECDDTTLVPGVALTFDDALGDLHHEIPPCRSIKKASRQDQLIFREEVPSRHERRNRPTIVSYREPKLNTKIRKGHHFFSVTK